MFANDAAFLRSVLASPNDDVVRLVCADWLEEQNDPRAEFLRLEHQLLKLSKEEREHSGLYPRFAEIALTLDADWVALVRRFPIADSIEVCLKKLEPLLGAYNHNVDFGLYRIPIDPNISPNQYIHKVLGSEVKTPYFQPVSGEFLLAHFDECIHHPIDDPPGSKAWIQRSSSLFQRLVAEVTNYLTALIVESVGLLRIGIDTSRSYNGYFPAAWGFDYLIMKSSYALIFLAWGWD
jgi:uncharacterized protein (TIGR02996 family)